MKIKVRALANTRRCVCLNMLAGGLPPGFLHGEQMFQQMFSTLILIGADWLLIWLVKRSKLTRDRKVLAVVLIVATSVLVFSMTL
jgi:hypothetical protein